MEKFDINTAIKNLNRDYVGVSQVDMQYCNLLKKIIKEGERTPNRTGIDTFSIPGPRLSLDLSKGFPILETKTVPGRRIVSEVLWIYIEQSNKVKWLQDRGNHTWDLWVVDDDGIYRIYEQGKNAVNDLDRMVPLKEVVLNEVTGCLDKVEVLDEKGKPTMVKSLDVEQNKDNPRTIREALWYGKELAGTIGEAYGYVCNLYKRPQFVEYQLKNNPTDRRMIIDLWQDKHMPKATMPSCVYTMVFKTTTSGKLHLCVTSRSADVPIGLPFDIAEHAILLQMYAKACGFEPGTLTFDISDAHIYENQLPGIEKQLKRFDLMKKYAKTIRNSSDDEILALYEKIDNEFSIVNSKVLQILGDVDNLLDDQQLEELKQTNPRLAKNYEKLLEQKLCFEHMLTRKTPTLELADKDSVFDFSRDFVNKDDPYLKENPMGNKDFVLKNYHPMSTIKMPVAQ